MTRYCVMSHERSLPTDIDRFERMIRRNADILEDAADGATDADWIFALAEERYDTIWWTAPADFEPGGILLLHLREFGDGSISPELLEKAMERLEHGDALVPNLFHAERLARRYGGTIFAAARVGSVAQRFGAGGGREEHSVVLNKAYVLEVPLPIDEAADVVEVGEGLFTQLGTAAFEELRSRLRERNNLPGFLEAA